MIVDGSCGKRRSIIRPSRREQVLHHMIINILSPIFLRPMYNHVHAAILGRGCLSGKKTLEKWIKRDYKGTKYYLKMDIRKYFESVPHEILKAKLAKIIKDKRFLTLVNNTIDIKCNGKYLNKGIPLGFYTSQWYANFYLTGLDHYIKEKLHAPYYMRYMDDMVILGGNKRKLIKIQQAIAEYLKENLGLTMKEN